MKKTIFFLLALFPIITGYSQFVVIPYEYLNTAVIDSLDINNVNAGIHAGGDLFTNHPVPHFRVPAESGKATIFASNLWIGGLTATGELHLAAQTFRQKGTDYWTGPLDITTASIDEAVSKEWDKIWKINKSTIDYHRIHWRDEDYTVPDEIKNWPAHGNPANNQSYYLAPFVDFNKDGKYTPEYGDYPEIKGNQAVYFIYNDALPHTESGGKPLGIEIHGLAYAFNCPIDANFNNTIFVHYKIINRSKTTYYNTFLGVWADIDIGYPWDDFVGCNVGLNSFYGYNGDNYDEEGGYGDALPAQGVTILRGPVADPNDGIDNDRDGKIDEPGETIALSKFICYNNDYTVIGEPWCAQHYYNYLNGIWIDNTPLTYGGIGYNPQGTRCNFIYPGISDHENKIQWDEVTSKNTPFDRRALGSLGPFTFEPAETLSLDIAYVFANVGKTQESIKLLEQYISAIKKAYENNSLSCSGIFSNIQEQTHGNDLYVVASPNPMRDYLVLEIKNLPENEKYNIEIYDINGALIKEINNIKKPQILFKKQSIGRGVYIYKIYNESHIFEGKFIVQ